MFSAVNEYVLGFLREVLPDIMDKEGNSDGVESSVGTLTKSSTFGEAEVEVRFLSFPFSITGRLTWIPPALGHHCMVSIFGKLSYVEQQAKCSLSYIHRKFAERCE